MSIGDIVNKRMETKKVSNKFFVFQRNKQAYLCLYKSQIQYYYHQHHHV